MLQGIWHSLLEHNVSVLQYYAKQLQGERQNVTLQHNNGTRERDSIKRRQPSHTFLNYLLLLGIITVTDNHDNYSYHYFSYRQSALPFTNSTHFMARIRANLLFILLLQFFSCTMAMFLNLLAVPFSIFWCLENNTI